MNKNKYLDDLKEIKDIMEKSTKFISLSGISGIIVGIIALVAAWVTYTTVYSEQDYFVYRKVILSSELVIRILLIAGITLFLSILTGILFTRKKARQNNQKLWDLHTRRLISSLMIPLGTGGILCLIILYQGFIGYLAPFTLIFYGLALVNASKFSLPEIKSLGLAEILLGLAGTFFIGYGLLLWAIGFGLLHIAYGIIMEVRYRT